MSDGSEEEDEKPVDFIPELNVLGQPKPKAEELPPASDFFVKPKFSFEPAIPQDRLLASLIDTLSLWGASMLILSSLFSAGKFMIKMA
jgi:hypothetical protein